MASNPQFLLDDQTDEDFFDKLVDDSYSPSQAHAAKELKFVDDGSDSEDAKAFANLSLREEAGNDDAVEGPSSEPSSSVPVQFHVINEGPSSEPSSIALEEADANKLSGDLVVRSEVEDKPLSEAVKESNGSGSPGVKEVDWGSFCADSSVNDGGGFGSYSDFFTQLDGSSTGNLQGKAEIDAGKLVSDDTQIASFGFDSSAGLGQQQGEVSQDSTSEQYVDNSQAWENSYPGWKYDASTGQWYQVDSHDDASMNAQESYINSASNWQSKVASTDNSNVAYLSQSTTSAVAESMSTWNQVSQVANGYPEHMVFDPQYPGWYYDTIAQEWRSLDSYNQASQTTVTGQAHEQQAQNGQIGAMFHNNTESSMYNINDKSQAFKPQEYGIQNQQGSWDQSYYANNQQQATNTWQSENGGDNEASVTSVSFSHFGGNQQVNSLYCTESVAEQFKPKENRAQGFIPQHMNVASVPQHGPLSFSNDFYNRQKSVDDTQQSYQSNQLFSPSVGRSPDGRPPHALVSFGFGGKLILMKDTNASLQNSSFGSQGAGGSSISVLNLAEVTSGSASFSSLGEDSSSYFRSLHQQCLPGPLVGGSVGNKDLIKWLDERILQCESSDIDFSRGKFLKMLMSLLRISCQYYGKLRSPFGADTTQKETDSVEAAVAKLFAIAKKNGGYAPLSQCLQHLPPESQMQVTGVGTKLEHVVSKLALEVKEQQTGTTAGAQVKPRDGLFWFGKPEILLRLIQFIIFQNAFEMATFIWFLWGIKERSCFMKNHVMISSRLISGVLVQFWCSYGTVPLNVIVTQMGSRCKKAVIAENVRDSLHSWCKRVKERSKHARSVCSLDTATIDERDEMTVGTLSRSSSMTSLNQITINSTDQAESIFGAAASSSSPQDEYTSRVEEYLSETFNNIGSMQPLNDEIEIEVESEEDNERRGSESEETNGEGGETLFDLFRRT